MVKFLFLKKRDRISSKRKFFLQGSYFWRGKLAAESILVQLMDREHLFEDIWR